MSAACSSESSDSQPGPRGVPSDLVSSVQSLAVDSAVALEREWLLTDGRGGYGCGTAGGVATRRYHGLWVTRTDGLAQRHMVVAGLDERLGPARRVGEQDPRFAHVMSAHWLEQAQPTAGDGQVSFARRPLPTWTFETEFGVIERTITLRREVPGVAPALLVRWRNCSDHPVRLEVRPLLGWCNVDHLLTADDSFDETIHASGASWGFRPTDELPHLWLSVDGVSAFRSEPVWYNDFLYAADRLRGYDHVGDRWSPGVLELDLPAGSEATASFALEEPLTAAAQTFEHLESQADAEWREASQQEHLLTAQLSLGARDFFYRSVDGRLGVIAGFPWFGEWGRDVFLALPGLTLARGDIAVCAEVMVGCLPFLRQGLLPNIYNSDVSSSDYGSCDAALWFALCVMRFADAGHDPELVQQKFLPALRSIVEAYEGGTDLGLKVAEDGLLQAGSEHLNATWMDARTSDGPVTPREGLPVEIQALWYALLTYLAEQFPESSYQAMRARCGKAFVKQFWLVESKSLADRVHAGVADTSVRPNMLVAAALSRSPLTAAQRQAVVKVVKAHLVTPCGLRTLSPEAGDYIGVYGGGIDGRDKAYHQGTVWPWPAGFYVEAALRAAPKRSRKREAKALLQWLDELLQSELPRAGLDHVSEVFDGDLPHRPGGTFAQAWNTGELLRAHALCQQVIDGTNMELQ